MLLRLLRFRIQYNELISKVGIRVAGAAKNITLKVLVIDGRGRERSPFRGGTHCADLPWDEVNLTSLTGPNSQPC